MLCATSEAVVIHDATLERTTNGTGKVSKKSLGSLKGLDAGSWFDSSFTGEQIPTLDEVFAEIGRDIFINVELKNYSSPFDNLAETVALSVRRHGLEEKVFFSSFNPLNFRRLKRHLPDVPTGFLTLRGWATPQMGWLARRFDALHPEYSDVSPELVNRAHTAGQRIYTYTVDDPVEARRLCAAGVDGIITNDPLNLRQALG